MFCQTCRTTNPPLKWYRLSMGLIVCPNCGAVYWLRALELTLAANQTQRKQTGQEASK